MDVTGRGARVDGTVEVERHGLFILTFLHWNVVVDYRSEYHALVTMVTIMLSIIMQY